MPQIAAPEESESLRTDLNWVPRGTSEASQQLAQCGVNSSLGFYGWSQGLQGYFFTLKLDTANIAEYIIAENLKETRAKINALLSWSEGWDGYDALAPNPNAVKHAHEWIRKLFLQAVDLDRPWLKPNVTASSEGEVLFEWWRGRKKLTVYVGDQNAVYVQVWGANIDTEMAEGDAEPVSACRMLWTWLTD